MSGCDSLCIFFCKVCRTIVADSSLYAHAAELRAFSEDSRTIVLSAACNVKVIDATEHSDKDLACYAPFRCTCCSSALGRQYVSTPRHLNFLQDMYTFDVDAINMYVCGTSEEGKGRSLCVNDNDPSSAVELLGSRLDQVARLLLIISERLDKLEQRQCPSGPLTSPPVAQRGLIPHEGESSYPHKKTKFP
eukprot:TRINITY_DN10600_c0_g1_i1.p1 TRINITY_DN10600_c0_g1~~TRINITY_DN10600_c0_g1_i1.p1  ORF type:complete len:191 (+),score=2.46 TRINITY_DN10600_c0_g1_i1:173-745(+)